MVARFPVTIAMKRKTTMVMKWNVPTEWFAGFAHVNSHSMMAVAHIANLIWQVGVAIPSFGKEEKECEIEVEWVETIPTNTEDLVKHSRKRKKESGKEIPDDIDVNVYIYEFNLGLASPSTNSSVPSQLPSTVILFQV